MSHMPEYPEWVCINCGIRYGRTKCGLATWHRGVCDLCKARADVTEPRDFGGLLNGWQDAVKADA